MRRMMWCAVVTAMLGACGGSGEAVDAGATPAEDAGAMTQDAGATPAEDAGATPAEDAGAMTQDAGAGAAPRWSTDVYPILAAGCAGAACHVGGRAAPQLGMTAASAYMAVTTGRGGCALTSTALVTPGMPDASLLYLKVSGSTCGTRMPLGRPALSAAEQQTISAWIAAGALDD